MRLPVTKISCHRKAAMPLGRPIRIGSMNLVAEACSQRRKNTARMAARPAQSWGVVHVVVRSVTALVS